LASSRINIKLIDINRVFLTHFKWSTNLAALSRYRWTPGTAYLQ